MGELDILKPSPEELVKPPEDEHWTAKCPSCREGKLEIKEKKILGIIHVVEFICPRCGATFKKQGEKIKVVSFGRDPHNLKNRFPEGTELYPEEWHRIAYGGLSDGELEGRKRIREAKQRELDMQKIQEAIAKGEITLGFGEAPIILKKNERLVFNLPGVELQEYRRTRLRGTYTGISFRIMKGVYLRTGGFGAGQSAEELKVVDIGNLVMTNKRFVFIGNRKSATVYLSKILGIEGYEDAIIVHAENRKNPVILSGLDRIKVTVSIDGRQYEFPLTGIYLKELIESAVRELE